MLLFERMCWSFGVQWFAIFVEGFSWQFFLSKSYLEGLWYQLILMIKYTNLPRCSETFHRTKVFTFPCSFSLNFVDEQDSMRYEILNLWNRIFWSNGPIITCIYLEVAQWLAGLCQIKAVSSDFKFVQKKRILCSMAVFSYLCISKTLIVRKCLMRLLWNTLHRKF